MNKRSKGNWGEQKAVDYLRRKGYKILSRNARTKRGEIDIIALHNNFLVFVEVKYRTSLAAGYPHEAVDSRKLAKLNTFVEAYYQQYNPSYPPRIEVVSLWHEDGEVVVKHFTDIMIE